MEIKKISIGIDPGSISGCISCIIEQVDGKTSIESFLVKDCTEPELFNRLSEMVSLIEDNGVINAVIEKVHAMPKQGVCSVASFMQNYGMLRGFLIALRVPFKEVTPQTWMKYYGFTKAKDESKTQWKKRLRQLAEQLFPEIKMKKDIADAILIANYCNKINT